MPHPKSPAKPNPVQVFISNPGWTDSERRIFLDSFQKSMQDDMLGLWVSALHLLPRETAYWMEDLGVEADRLFRLSLSPGYSGGDLKVDASLVVPKAFESHQQAHHMATLGAAINSFDGGWYSRLFFSIVSFVMSGGQQIKKEVSREVNDKMRLEALDSVPLYAADNWNQVMGGPLACAMLRATNVAAQSVVDINGSRLSMVRLQVNDKYMDFPVLDGVQLRLGSSDLSPKRSMFLA